MDVKFGTSKNVVNADRIMKFIDENELNYIWRIRCDNSETVRDRISVLFGIGTLWNNCPMSAHASQAFNTSTVPIPGD